MEGNNIAALLIVLKKAFEICNVSLTPSLYVILATCLAKTAGAVTDSDREKLSANSDCVVISAVVHTVYFLFMFSPKRRLWIYCTLLHSKELFPGLILKVIYYN